MFFESTVVLLVCFLRRSADLLWSLNVNVLFLSLYCVDTLHETQLCHSSSSEAILETSFISVVLKVWITLSIEYIKENSYLALFISLSLQKVAFACQVWIDCNWFVSWTTKAVNLPVWIFFYFLLFSCTNQKHLICTLLKKVR